MLIGYNTNGFAHHRLDDALSLLAEIGYQAVAITPDVHHLDPFSTSTAELRELRRRLEALGLAVVLETGARFLLDPRRKHRPNLLEREEAARRVRIDFLVRCAEMASELGAGVISTWSGGSEGPTSPGEAMERLVAGLTEVCDAAGRLGVRVALEPEPGMWVETLAGWASVRDAVGSPSLGLTLDTGHVPCTEDMTPAEAIACYRSDLLNVHLDDVKGGVHEHLQIGEGELDWPSILRELAELPGVASVELSRHSHDAPRAAATALASLRAAGI